MESLDYARLWAQHFSSGQASMTQYRQEESAKAYDSSELIWKDGYKRAAGFDFLPDDDILDIGCGPGILAIPLAARVKHVTLLDPSAPMLRLAKKHADENGISNISLIRSGWEDIDLKELGMFDHVIASYSLGMPDIKEALLKMNAAARKSVTLYWFNGTTTWERIAEDLSPTVLGRPAKKHPKADIIYGVLSDLGISADITHLHGTSFPKDFSSREEALDNLRSRFGIHGNEFDALFSAYLVSSGVYDYFNGKWRYTDSTNYVKISWKKCL